MVETKLEMKKILLMLSLAALVSCAPQEYSLTWRKHVIDGHLTGVTAPNADNVPEALGTVAGGVYTAPNGKVFRSGSTPAVANALIAVQPQMARLKEVLGHAPVEMIKDRPESGLSNMVADILRAEVAELSGRQVDVAITNYGGIRIDLPAGDILLDDVVSMLPFHNQLCYLTLKGCDLRNIFDFMAKTEPQAVSGVRLVIEDHKLVSAEVDGQPLDDNKLYGVATVDFLLDGGDELYVAKNAKELVIYEEEPSAMFEKYLRSQTAAGKEIEYASDGRVIWKR